MFQGKKKITGIFILGLGYSQVGSLQGASSLIIMLDMCLAIKF